jgi:ABC-type amino acid transport system permease subunit
MSTVYFNPIESYTVVAFMFFFLIYPGTLFLQYLERRLSSND